ncbi:MAG TPA: LysR substrate-binding domain-containing protein [Beijerinckiaceae bacterium]|nr:LysR substrate-binding domain-containing protein [Beijerinckiaceae bacterium]
MHFDLSDLRLFVGVAEAGNLTRGARLSFLSAPAASARIKGLERQLATRLLWRDARGVRLTDAGETLLRHARVILRQVEHLKHEFGAAAGATGHIRIAANTTAVTEFMPELLARFLAERPGVTVDLQERLTQDIVASVLDGSADLGIVSGRVPTEGLQALHFSTDRLVLATPLLHPLAGRGGVAFAETLAYEHIGLHEGSTLLAFIRALMDQHGHDRPLRIQVRSFEAMCRMVEAGVGVGIMPESAAIRHSKTMRIATAALVDSWALRERCVLVREIEALPASARDLVDRMLRSGSGGSSVTSVASGHDKD